MSQIASEEFTAALQFGYGNVDAITTAASPVITAFSRQVFTNPSEAHLAGKRPNGIPYTGAADKEHK